MALIEFGLDGPSRSQSSAEGISASSKKFIGSGDAFKQVVRIDWVRRTPLQPNRLALAVRILKKKKKKLLPPVLELDSWEVPSLEKHGHWHQLNPQ